MRPLILLDVVGLSQRHLGPHTPHLTKLADTTSLRRLVPVLPAVTCSVQSTLLTGLAPRDHGIVGNGWYFRDLGEILFWRQSNRLVQGEKIWESAKRYDPGFTCANLFWWYNMHTSVDISVTPRPIYRADGRKIPDFYTAPADLHAELQQRLGRFPLFRFWGPMTSIDSSRWITEAALHVRRTRAPTLTLIYLPHLDYGLQRLGPDDPAIVRQLREVDALCGEIIADAGRDGAQVLVVSEYAIETARRPVHINRALRQAGFLSVRDELGFELLDPAASLAFAVADHQVAHVYVRDRDAIDAVAASLRAVDGIDTILDGEGKRAVGLDHERSGELVTVAEPGAWFTYYYWLDDAHAPDFARTVEIHRKPGYDPAELFIDPTIRLPKAALAFKLAKQTLGFRSLLDVIPLDASLVRGTHGRAGADAADAPLIVGADPDLIAPGSVPAASVARLVLDHMSRRTTA